MASPLTGLFYCPPTKSAVLSYPYTLHEFYNMQHDTITFKEWLTLFDAGNTCSMVVIAANKEKQTGGEELKFNQVKKYMQQKTVAVNSNSNGITNSKKPNHHAHATRNVLLPTGEIKKIHIRLVIEFNGKQVI